MTEDIFMRSKYLVSENSQISDKKKIFKKSQVLFYLSLAFLVGIALGDFVILKNKIFFWLIVGLIFPLILAKKQRLIFWCLIFIVLGIFQYNLFLPQETDAHILFYNQQQVVFRGVVMEPDIRIDHTKLTIKTSAIKIAENWQKINGKVLIKTNLYPQYEYGDLIEAQCRLQKPQAIEKFAYDQYLARYDIYSICYFAKIKKIDSRQGNFLIAKLLMVKDKISFIINHSIAEPQASFLAGILIGSRKGIPEELMENFNRTGVTHIIAISGYNITVISVMVMNLCLSLRIHRKKAFWVIFITIVFFVIITGASAAVTRSAIMGVLVLFTKYVGRKSNTRNILIITAVLMSLANPKILMFDVGFQLSFLATIGLIYFVPVIEKYFFWLPKKFGLQENFVTTISAIVWTTPLILYQFERFSIVAPVVNVLILSVIPLSMLLGFIQVLAGLLFLSGAKIAGWATWLVLEYIIVVVNFFADLKFAYVQVKIDLWLMIFCYIILLILVMKKKKYETNY